MSRIPVVLDLEKGATAIVRDLSITLSQASHMLYFPANVGTVQMEDAEKKAMVVLDLEHGGERRQAILVEGHDWGRDLTAFGYGYRVTSPPTIDADSVRIEVLLP